MTSPKASGGKLPLLGGDFRGKDVQPCSRGGPDALEAPSNSGILKHAPSERPNVDGRIFPRLGEEIPAGLFKGPQKGCSQHPRAQGAEFFQEEGLLKATVDRVPRDPSEKQQ